MHWGTFQLTDEGIDEPVNALATALAEAGLPDSDFRALERGGKCHRLAESDISLGVWNLSD
jgi:hypothetical protein